jgi:hypothetical protein
MAKTGKGSSSKRKPAARARSSKSVAAPRKVTGTVLKIVNGKPSNIRLDAAAAFSDIDQARAQVLYVEKHGSREEKRLVRLAFRQYQGIRFRTK